MNLAVRPRIGSFNRPLQGLIKPARRLVKHYDLHASLPYTTFRRSFREQGVKPSSRLHGTHRTLQRRDVTSTSSSHCTLPDMEESKEIVFLHFNDVYHISDQNKIARFVTLLESYRRRYPDAYTVFSGDVFSPSLEASILTGEHMLPILRELNIDVACYGNHDFDFGELRLTELEAQTNFPWLLSNVTRLSTSNGCDGMSPNSEDMLAGAAVYHTKTLQGLKFGFFALAGTDWPENCHEAPNWNIAPPVEAARQCATYLRNEAHCDFVIALTHMRLAEDIEVAEASRSGGVDHVDLLLGGHDHDTVRRFGGDVEGQCQKAAVLDCRLSKEDLFAQSPDGISRASGDIRIIKSGTDWQSLSCVKLRMRRNEKGKAVLESVEVEQIPQISRVQLDPAELSAQTERIAEILRPVSARIEELGAHALVHTTTDLEGRGRLVRSQETNLGNFLADITRLYYDCDIAFVNGGGIRCEKVIGATVTDSESESEKALTVRDLIEIVPFDQPLMVKRITGEALVSTLENAFSDKHTDGRFLQMSGLRVEADWQKPPGSRIQGAWCSRAGGMEPVQADSKYTVAMVSFIANGFDGYVWLRDQETLVSEEGAITDTKLLLRTLGYGHAEGAAAHEPGVEQDEARFQRARDGVVKGYADDGLPIIGPVIDRRIDAKD